jgi:cell division septation protein DedD
VPRPIPTVAVSPSIAAARAAVAEASSATGTENPDEAGASFARPAAVVEIAADPVPDPAPPPAAVTVVRSEAPPVAPPRVAPPPAAANGPWRIQLGAFSVAGNAERLWSQLSGRAELAGRQRLLVPAGRVMKLQAGGFASRASADAACRSLQQSGQDCLVTDR